MISLTAVHLNERTRLRRLNLDPAPQRSAFAARSSGLKFDVKKATALAKRFKNYSAEASEKTILMQLDTVSFGKFLSEAAHAVVQSLCHGTKMKPADVHSFAVVCSEVHQRYEDFWTLVRKELKENIESVVDTGSLKVAVERIEEYASTTSHSGEGNAPTGTTVVSSGLSAPPSAAAKGGLTPSLSKSPVDELNRLRLVARVFCEWWLVGLFDDAKPLLNLLKLLHKLTERNAATPNSPLAVATVFSITALIIREVGIEILGKGNAALSCLFTENNGDENGPERLRDLLGHCGVLTIDENSEEGSKTAFLLGPAGARLAFNATTKTVGPVENAVAQQAEEVSWARLCETRNPSAEQYCNDEEKRQFFRLAFASTKACLRAYKQRRKEIEEWWRSVNDPADPRGKTARFNLDEARFRLFQEHVERLYVVCENLLGMLGFSPPLPVDLSIVEQKEEVEAVRITVTQKFYPIVGAETLNRFGDDEHRVFYEYVPEIEALLDEVVLSSLTAEKANWELFSRHIVIGGAIATGTGATTSSALCGVGSGGVGAAGGGDGGDSEEDDMDVEAAANTMEEGKGQHDTENVKLKERRRLRLAKLSVPAALFNEYAAVLNLLEELGECTTAAAIDEWCERFVGEALQPLRQSSGNAVGARLFFTNCRMLLTLELRHFLRLRYPEKLPFMARCAAIFDQYFPDVGRYLGGKLEAQWRREYSAPTSTREKGRSCSSLSDEFLQRRVGATGRYLCELMKFGTIPPSRVLSLLNIAVEDLKQPCSVATIHTIIEHGGLFLVRNYPTRRATEKLIQKLKTNMRKEEMKEEWFHMVKEALSFLQPEAPLPVEVPSLPQKEQSLLERYVRFLLHERLCSDGTTFVLDGLLKMPWDDVEKREMLVCALRSVHQMSLDAVPLLVDVLKELALADHIHVVQRILYEVAEDMRRDLEVGAATPEGVNGISRKSMMVSEPYTTHRPLQWRLADCFFLANFYRVRLVSFRFVCHMLLMQLLYFPFVTTHGNDYTRLRCFVTLFRECIPSLPWSANSRTGDLKKRRSRKSRTVERVVTLHQLLRKLLAELYLYRFSLSEPLPLQQQLCLEELLHLLRDNMDRDEEYRESWNKLQEKLKANEKGSQKESEETSNKKTPQLEIKSLPKLVLPETLEEAQAYAKSVAEETLLPANAWYEKVYEAIKCSQNDEPLFRILAVGNERELSLCTSEAVHVEGADGENSTHVSLDLLLEDMEQDDEVSTEHSSDADGNDDSTVRDITGDRCSSVGSISGSSSSVYERGGETLSDSDNVDTSVALSATVSDTTSTVEEEEGEKDEEEEDEEESEEEEEDEEEKEEEEGEEQEEEEEEEEADFRFAAAEALRIRLEEADLDAELRALMSENPREGMGHAASAAIARGTSVERLMEQELVMGIRMHRQYQRQCAQNISSVPGTETPKEDTPQEVRFTLLRRPPPNKSAAGKTGTAGVAASTSPSANTAVTSANVPKNSNFAVLSIPRGTEFAQNAMMSQERHRKQQEELREITRRINRMHEVERSFHASMPKEL
ncbi:hypothetical protein MOQ_000491 [Trypanosoma cruzi marinkellei]|uniref:MIF4G domain-containing protein n=1 Tax=Trypanosoma cruzi marinkellei TaxID=85056 RepID=K2NNA8_TRYCR|nr:hypothetical protein MOQ_000491 [Trypanosoma cruzi marinkellei]